MNNLKEIVLNFDVEGDVIIADSCDDGHINDTYYVNVGDKRYILQRINSDIFKNPAQIMSNIEKITDFLKEKIIKNGGDPSREALNIVSTKDGATFYKTPDNDYYRMYDFIIGARTYQIVEKPIHFYNAAKAFGKFQKMLSDFPANELYEPIPDFHNTRTRFDNLLEAIKADKAGRAHTVQKEIQFALDREDQTDVLLDLIEKGDIPLRVTHNDTKYNNIMIDDVTGEGICIIDLDTVMPGSLLYDYGDSLRFGTNPAAEDEKDLSKVYMDNELFECFTKGFLEVMRDNMTKAEIQYMPFSAKLITYECGIRFLTDYLDGDVYFRTHYPRQNLDRARTQFKLVSDMEEKAEYMKEIVEKYAYGDLSAATLANKQKEAAMEVYIPDNLEEITALASTTHLAVAAHQDDIEIMAYDGILKCFGQKDKNFTGVVVTNGSGSPRSGIYADYTDEQMQKLRKDEQKKAALIGGYSAQIFLDYESSSVKSSKDTAVINSIKEIIIKTKPDYIYTHNLADKHDTHVAVAFKLITALRELNYIPKAVYGCEVWRNLDWMCDEDKVQFDVSGRGNLEAALLGVFDSQIAGGKRYDLAAAGRRIANATFNQSHNVDKTDSLTFAMDLTPLAANKELDIKEFVLKHIKNFATDVEKRIGGLE